MPAESKKQKNFEKNKNSRVNKILERLLSQRPTIQDENRWKDSAPEFPTFPSPAAQEKLKKAKRSPFLS